MSKQRERYDKWMKERVDFAKEKGYIVDTWFTNSWSFSKDGKKSVLGFDSPEEVYDFIFRNEPDPEKIFPPYKTITP